MRFLTTDEVAELLRCHRSTVQRMAQSGKFPGAKVIGNGQRRSWRIPESSLDELQPGCDAVVKVKPVTVSGRGLELYRKFSKCERG
jgi:excisionase family DNA binding protein